MKKKHLLHFLFFVFLLLIYTVGQSQTTKDTVLIFNNKPPKIKKEKVTYYIEDLLATDSIKTNIHGLIIKEFTVTCGCQTNYVDMWESKNNNAILSDYIKKVLGSCINYNLSQSNDKYDLIVYFENVKAIDKSGNDITIKEFRIHVKHKKKSNKTLY